MGDLYDILGISSTASKKEIRAAFQKKAKLIHPDINPNDPTAKAKFQQLSEAYAILSDKNRRAQYDVAAKYQPNTPSPVSSETDFDDWITRMTEQLHKETGYTDTFKKKRHQAYPPEPPPRKREAAEAWELEKQEAQERLLRNRRIKERAMEANAMRRAVILRQFWQTKRGMTWPDVAVAILTLVSVSGGIAAVVQVNSTAVGNCRSTSGDGTAPALAARPNPT